MFRPISQMEAERDKIHPSRLQCVSPYLNPAHVLSPPRHWLEALVSGEFSWAFFRLRYKSLLRKRYNAEPERFLSLLRASAEGPVYLTCHCLGESCHRELAAEFLVHLQGQHLVRAERSHSTSRKHTPPTRKWSHAPQPGMVLATLIEHPHATIPHP